MKAGLLRGAPVGRISDRKTFAALQRPAIRVCRGPVSLSWVDDGPRGEPRIAYAVGRRVGGAVERNLIRRRLRAIFAEVAPALPRGSYLVSVSPGARRAGFADLRRWARLAVEALGTGEAEAHR